MEPIMADDFLELALTYNGDTDRNKIVVDESKLHRPQQTLRALTGHTTGMRNGFGKKIGDRQIKVFHKRPWLSEIEVTANAAAGDTALYVKDTSMITDGEVAYHREANQRVRVTDAPISLTQLQVRALTSAVTAGDIIKLQGPSVGEDWTRGTPKHRTTGFHTDYVSTKQAGYAFSWHDQFRDKYLISDPMLVERDFYERWEMQLNHELMFGLGGTETSGSETLYFTRGLYSHAAEYNYFSAPGVMTRELVFEIMFQLMAEGNATHVDIICGQRLATKLATALYGTGFQRYAQGDNPLEGKMKMTGGSPVNGMTFSISVDMSMNGKGYEDSMLFVNWAEIEPLAYGDTYFQRNVQDPGSGRIHHQLTRCIGFKHNIPTGTAALVDGISAVRP
jgi:hypothetical protein